MKIASILIILGLMAIMIYLILEFNKERKLFSGRIETLKKVILDMSKKQLSQQEQLKIVIALDESMKAKNQKLQEDIYGLNYNLFEILAKNNLV